ncbi:MAG: hypothetical protein K8L91_24160 [Anaerolineae bacterium]|nr:hypothetical protein [Anaerolineae bacterium]
MRKIIIALSFICLNILTFVSYTEAQEVPKFNSCAGKLSFEYPLGWSVLESQFSYEQNHRTNNDGRLILLANNEVSLEALEADLLAPEAQTISITLIMLPPEFQQDPFERLSNITSDPFPRVYSGVRVFELNGWPAARRDYTLVYEDLNIAGFIIDVALPNNYNLHLIAETHSNLIFDLDANVGLILSSLTFKALDTDLPLQNWTVYYEPKCTFRLAYPNDWIISQAYSNQLIFFNSQDAQDTRRRRRDYEDDQLEVKIIQPKDLPEFFGDIGFDSTDTTPEAILMAYAEAERLSVETSVPFTVGEHNVLRADFTGGFILLYDFGEGQYAILAARSSEDGFAAFEETILQIAGSVQYNPIQADEPAIEITPTPTP